MLDFSALWLADPYWQAMDATAKGFHTQLLLLALRQGGRLPDDDQLWRQWLGVPESEEVRSSTEPAAALTALCLRDADAGLSSYPDALAYYWAQRWKPMLLRAWTLTPDGYRTCALVRELLKDTSVFHNTQETAQPPATSPELKTAAAKKPRAKKAKPSKGPDLAHMNWDALASPRGPAGEGILVLAPLPDKIFERDQIQARWHVPVNRSMRLQIWTIGLSMLSSEAGDEANNRKFLSAQIKRYGERRVAAAIGDISGRVTRPADPKSFLLGILKKNTEGTAAAQRAREVRAGAVV